MYHVFQTTEVGVKILADVIESYLAALLLDKGLDYCQRFLEVCLFPKLLEIVEKSTVDDTNTQLQKAVARLCRQQHLEHEGPHYRQVGSSRNPPFTVGVYFKGQRLGTGVGASLRDARQKAGECALESDTLKLMGLDTRQKK
jgi:ribonuclease-3